MKERPGPCQEKKCSWCCDPVKVHTGFPEAKIPKDKDGNPLWKERAEILISKEKPDTSRLKTYDCKNLDQEIGSCRDYKNRPEICRNSSCINERSLNDVDEQHKQTVEQQFYNIKTGRKTE